MIEQLAVLWGNVNEQTLLLGVLFAAVVLTVAGVAGLARPVDPVERRLAEGATPAAGAGIAVRNRDDGKLLKGIGAYITPKDEGALSSIRRRLYRAGYRRPGTARNFYGLRLLLGLAGPLAMALVFPLLSRRFDLQTVLILGAVAGMVGFYGPWFWIANRASARMRAVRDGFPDALDMLLVSVEAGLSLDAALNRVATEIAPAHPILAEELTIVGLELRAGKARMDVLHDMALRMGVDEVNAFVTVLAQSDRFGTSIADALRVYAAEMRAKRLVRAEEQANKLPFKLAVAVMTCTLPAVLVILAFPALISLMSTLKNLRQ